MDTLGLRDELASVVRFSEAEDGVRVTTHCLYPSNDLVTLIVRWRDTEFVVSDEGRAVQEISATRIPMSDRQIRALVKHQGLNVQGGAIYSPRVGPDAVAAAILLVANASKEVADWGTEHLGFKMRHNFKRDLAELLEKHFSENLKHDEFVVGQSNKAHRFNHVLHLNGQRLLLIDPAINESSSINSRVVANMDVRMREDPDIQQLIVFDDALKWSSSELKLLELGARTVPFSRAEPEIARLAV